MLSYETDVMAKCGLGIEANSFTQPNGIMRSMSRQATGDGEPSAKMMRAIFFTLLFPKIAHFFGTSYVEEDPLLFFENIVLQSRAAREKNKERHNDFIDLMLDVLKEDAKHDMDDDENDSEDDEDDKADRRINNAERLSRHEDLDRILVANVTLLYWNGIDTSSTIMSYALHHLADNPLIQSRLYEEIYELVQRIGGIQNLDYTSIRSLKFLDQVIQETLRLHPLFIVERTCVKEYKVPGTDFVIPKGMLVQIPNSAIMMDEEYFKNPTKFDPSRWTPLAKAKRDKYAFMAFGQGPRNCIGSRFAKLQVKISLVKILYNFQVFLGPSAPKDLVADPHSFGCLPKGMVWIKVKKRSTCK